VLHFTRDQLHSLLDPGFGQTRVDGIHLGIGLKEKPIDPIEAVCSEAVSSGIVTVFSPRSEITIRTVHS